MQQRLLSAQSCTVGTGTLNGNKQLSTTSYINYAKEEIEFV